MMLFGGPQGERDREKLWLGSASINDPIGNGKENFAIEREELRVKLDQTVEKQVYEGEVIRLKKENVWMQDHLQRALKELKLYQVKYPSPFSQMGMNAEELEDEDLPHWTTSSSEALGPLMHAYDTRVRELEDGISKQSHQLEAIHDKFQEILAENESLRESQIEQIRSSGQPGIRGTGTRAVGGLPFDSMSGELIAELNERVDILMAENAVLLEQKSVLSQVLERQREDLVERTEELTEVTAQLEELSKEFDAVQNRIAQAEKDRAEATERALQQRNESNRLLIESDSLREELSSSQRRCEESDKGAQSLKRQLKELISQSEREGLSYMRTTKLAEDAASKLHSDLLQKSQELEAALEELRRQRRECQSIRQDAEGMLQVMNGYERQITAFAGREEEMERRVRECREVTEQAISSRDRASAREEHHRVEVERLQEERKRAAQSVQVQVDSALALARERAVSAAGVVEGEMEELTKRNALLRVELEASAREARSLKETVARLQRLQEDERRAVNSALKGLEENFKAAVVAKEEEARRARELLEANKEHRGAIDKLRNHSDSLRLQAEARTRQLETEIAELKSSCKESSRDASDKARAVARKQRDFEEFRAATELQLATLDKRRQEEVGQLQRRVDEVEGLLREQEKTAASDLHGSQLAAEQIKEKSSATVAFLESRLVAEREAAQQLSSRIAVLERTVVDIQEEKLQLALLVEDTRRTNIDLEEELEEARSALMQHVTSKISSFEIGDDPAFSLETDFGGAEDADGDRQNRPLSRYKDGNRSTESLLSRGASQENHTDDYEDNDDDRF